MLYMVTFTINIPPMLAYIYIPYMDPMGHVMKLRETSHTVHPGQRLDLTLQLEVGRVAMAPWD